MDKIFNTIIKNSDYGLMQFSDISIDATENNIIVKKDKSGNDVYYILCPIRNKEIKLTPDEAVRQLYIHKLINEYGYPAERIAVDFGISFGNEKKKADIAVLTKYVVSPEIYNLENATAVENADVNHDSSVTSADVQRLIEFILKTIPSLDN